MENLGEFEVFNMVLQRCIWVYLSFFENDLWHTTLYPEFFFDKLGVIL
jgi:hypothetical protein